MSFICIDCSPKGAHPVFQEKGDFLLHRAQAHDEYFAGTLLRDDLAVEEKDDPFHGTEPDDYGDAVIASMQTDIATLKAAVLELQAAGYGSAILDSEEAVKVLGSRLDSLGSQVVALTALQLEQSRRLDNLEAVKT